MLFSIGHLGDLQIRDTYPHYWRLHLLTAHAANGAYSVHLVSEASAPVPGPGPSFLALFLSPPAGLVVQQARPHPLGPSVHAQISKQAYSRTDSLQPPLLFIRLQKLRQLFPQQTSKRLGYKYMILQLCKTLFFK